MLIIILAFIFSNHSSTRSFCGIFHLVIWSSLNYLKYRGTLLYVDYNFSIYILTSFFMKLCFINYVKKSDIIKSGWNLAHRFLQLLQVEFFFILMIQIMIQWAKDPKWSQSQIVMDAFDRVRRFYVLFTDRCTALKEWFTVYFLYPCRLII